MQAHDGMHSKYIVYVWLIYIIYSLGQKKALDPHLRNLEASLSLILVNQNRISAVALI